MKDKIEIHKKKVKNVTLKVKRDGSIHLTVPEAATDDYIERIINSDNEDALEVKLADLKHNMDISRLENPTVKDFSRIEKRYRPNYIKIQNKLNEMRK